MYKLIIEDDEGKTTVVNLIRDETTIGRKEGNAIRLTERNVSRKHARLFKANGAVYIEDLSSYNGTRVNGERISGRAPIAEGDRIQIGDYQLALKLDRTAATEPPVESRADEKTSPYVSSEKGNSTALMEAPRMAPPAQPAPASQTQVVPPPSGATVPMPQVSDERPARLVVVSSNFAGKEFRLDKREAVIGRTDDNDIVINHRSISRHHAKILKEGGRYQVQDLGSANGVRVNGEDYGKVELRKGDLIDLGHVRLRFVAPAEDFVFARDAKVVDVEDAKGGMPKAVVFGGIAAAVAVVGAIVAVVMFKGPKTDDPSAAGGTQVAAIGATGGANPSGKASGAKAAVEAALKAMDWDKAIAEANKGLADDPKDADLEAAKSKAEAEKKFQAIYEDYQKAVKSEDLKKAVTLYPQLEKSAYREKADDSWTVVKNTYVREELSKAKGLQASSKCDEAKRHIEEVLFVDETNAEAQELAKKCGQPAAPPHHEVKEPREKRPVVAPPPPRPVVEKAKAEPREEVVEHKAEPKPEPKVEPKPAGGVDAIIGEAQDDYVRGNYSSAVDKARKALKSDPNNSRAWRIAGASSCFLKDKTSAASAWNHLGNMDRQFLKYVCGRNAITIP